MSEEPMILEAMHDRVHVLTFNRIAQRNAFNNAMYHRVSESLEAAAKDDDVGAVLVTGAGGAFCAGQDLSEINAQPEGEEVGFERLLDLVSRYPKPLLAAVDGLGLGLGVTFLLHCDIVWFSDRAKLKCPFVTLGVAPEAGSSFLLPETIGLQRTAEWLYTGRWMLAEEAVEVGLGLEVFAQDALMPHALGVAKTIAAMPPASLQETKALLHHARLGRVDRARELEVAAFGRRLGSPENLEAVQAFFEKRPPDFAKLRKG